ncbi:hypothetical protein Q5424_14830 [Conexibacter sp. JD483]|uniref:hypothetical protein n=1 Tax=unclassified Conexibacter TaxID=2627773 RepID=UPI002716C4E5|nr:MULTISPECIES: hypothetical protein [unclassified Conexibacter]MDO8188008.1 hypothetical protein [Conexibacter sp. CPCC 205706]MDO8200891.1 hypothetical protein [Conexibacter sp. CPCC 205762]MDR9370376.1 hypothetical protein [Conexibacter sp. JD483]
MAATDHRALLQEAIAIERSAQQALLRGDAAVSRERFAAAAERYRASWEAAPPSSYGRLVGMVKAGVLAGHGGEEAAYVREAVGDSCDSSPGCYALALAALVQGDDEAAHAAVAGMATEDPAFARTAVAIDALARRDADGYAAAVRGIVSDFEERERHLTGIPFADTAVVLERLARPRGLAVRPSSALMPVLG